MTLASIVLLLYAFIFKKKITVSKSLMFKLLFSGMIIALHWITFFKAIKVSNVSITLSILSLGAFITSILEPLYSVGMGPIIKMSQLHISLVQKKSKFPLNLVTLMENSS